MRIVSIVLLVLGFIAAGCTSGSKTPAPSPAPTPAPATAPAPVPAKEVKDTSSTAEWRCTKGEDVRTIKIENRTPKGCRLMYPNANQEVAGSAAGDAYCIKVRSRIRGNLEAAGFSCTN